MSSHGGMGGLLKLDEPSWGGGGGTFKGGRALIRVVFLKVDELSSGWYF